jgi:hypothetical protein
MKNITQKIDPPRFDKDGYQINIKDLNGEPLPDFSKAKFVRLHGGARQGAGRKPLGKTQILLRLQPKSAAAIRDKAKRTHQTISEVVDELVAANL